tara:strand:+ start:371 stop:475 length:105 start_codon:yes stop_codon:yes gene_type:complete
MQHFLYFFPDPQWHFSLGFVLDGIVAVAATSCYS